jgi:putative MFS transporter
MATLCIQRRVDALNPRLSGFYVRLLLLSGLSWAVRSAELVLFTFTRRLVAKSVGMGTHALEALGVGVFLGSALGGPLFGLLADARGRMVALLEAFTGLGGVVGVALAFGLAPQLGWRVTYLAICGCVVYVGVLRFGIPESPRWLASVGRVDEALLAVEKLEREHGRYENATVQDKPMTGEATTVTSLDPFPVSTLVLSVLWAVMAVSAYALGVYVPSLISLWGFNMFSRWSTMALLGVAQAFGCVLASLVLGDCDRKQALVCFVAAAAVAAVVYSHAPWNGPLVIGGSFVVQI